MTDSFTSVGLPDGAACGGLCPIRGRTGLTLVMNSYLLIPSVIIMVWTTVDERASATLGHRGVSVPNGGGRRARSRGRPRGACGTRCEPALRAVARPQGCTGHQRPGAGGHAPRPRRERPPHPAACPPIRRLLHARRSSGGCRGGASTGGGRGAGAFSPSRSARGRRRARGATRRSPALSRVDLVACVQDRRVVAAAELGADAQQRDVRLRAHQVHGDLPWHDDGPVALLAPERLQVDAVVLRHGLARCARASPSGAWGCTARSRARPGPGRSLIGMPLMLAYATIRLSAPSSSRMLLTTFRAMNSSTSEPIGTPWSSALARRIAMRVSRSGAVRSAMRPHSKRLRRRSSSVMICFGGRSLDSTICLPSSWIALNVWKNSSWVRSLSAMNWMSSIRRTSMLPVARAELVDACPAGCW